MKKINDNLVRKIILFIGRAITYYLKYYQNYEKYVLTNNGCQHIIKIQSMYNNLDITKVYR